MHKVKTYLIYRRITENSLIVRDRSNGIDSSNIMAQGFLDDELYNRLAASRDFTCLISYPIEMSE